MSVRWDEDDGGWVISVLWEVGRVMPVPEDVGMWLSSSAFEVSGGCLSSSELVVASG